MSIKGNDVYLIVYWNSDRFEAAILKIYYSEAMAEKYFSKKYDELSGHGSHLERLYLFRTNVSFIDGFEIEEYEEASRHVASFIMNHLGNLHIIHENALD